MRRLQEITKTQREELRSSNDSLAKLRLQLRTLKEESDSMRTESEKLRQQLQNLKEDSSLMRIESERLMSMQEQQNRLISELKDTIAKQKTSLARASQSLRKSKSRNNLVSTLGIIALCIAIAR